MGDECSAAGTGQTADRQAASAAQQSADEHSDARSRSDVDRLTMTTIETRSFVGRVLTRGRI